MISRKAPLIIIAIVFVCAIGIPFATFLFFEKQPAARTKEKQPAARTKYNSSESTVFDGITKSGARTTSYQFPLPNGEKIWESFTSYELTNEAEKENLEMLKQAKEILEQGLAPNKGYNEYQRTVAVYSDYVAIFGIKGKSLFYCIKAPSLELAMDFEKDRTNH